MSAHKYELMFIADPELDERGLKKLTEQYLEIVTNEGGSVENIDIWGRRKLAYEIAGKTEGNYTSTSGAVASSPMRSPARPRATTWWSTTPASPPRAPSSTVCSTSTNP